MENLYHLIEYHHVMEAIKLISEDQRRLHSSVGYDLVVNGKTYPPKEILRIAYQLATGQEIGRIYGGDRVNKHFINLGFDIVQKSKVWKLGCNWESDNPSFFNFIRKEGLVISVDDFPYRIGDLVLVTEGFTVYALARVTGQLESVTQFEEFEAEFEKYNIPFESWVKVAKAEWYALKQTEVFQYKLQQGIRQVRKHDIIENAIDLWENRNSDHTGLRFHQITHRQTPSPNWSYPCIAFKRTTWSDHGYYTSFMCYYYKDIDSKISFGQVKILMEGEKETFLPEEFSSLSDNYISLGQSSKYYDFIKYELPFDREKVLSDLNDCTIDTRLNYRFFRNPGFKVSLLRSSEAERLFLSNRDNEVLLGNRNSGKNFEFSFAYKLQKATVPHKVEFSFRKDERLPNRFFCLIGKNGTGKTKYISQLAKKLADNNEEGFFYPNRPIFSQIKAISFSLFDNFGVPKKQDVNYDLVSLKDKDGLFDSDQNNKVLWNAYKELIKDRERKIFWYSILDASLELQNININTDAFDATTLSDFIAKIDDIFSSGQKITFHFFTRLLSTIETGSIILFDEPETHLHPNIVSRILNALNLILHQFDSYCIIATHSPVILQEIPSKFIRVFERQENMPVIFIPTIECFGENLSNISNSIFHVNEEEEIYKHTFKQLAEQMSFDEILTLFDNKLSLNAQLYLRTILEGENL